MFTPEEIQQVYIDDMNDLGFCLVSLEEEASEGDIRTHMTAGFRYKILREATEEEVTTIKNKYGYGEMLPYRYIISID